MEEGTLLILRAIVRIGPGFFYPFLNFWGISKNGITGVRAPAFHFSKCPSSWEKKKKIMQDFTVMTCQKFCSVSGGNLIKHIFSSWSREGISFFHNAPPPVSPQFLHWISGSSLRQVKPLVSQRHYGNRACTWLSPLRPYFGNDLHLGLYPT